MRKAPLFRELPHQEQHHTGTDGRYDNIADQSLGTQTQQAEQQASLSVANYLSDEQCATLLDKYARLERKLERVDRKAQ